MRTFFLGVGYLITIGLYISFSLLPYYIAYSFIEPRSFLGVVGVFIFGFSSSFFFSWILISEDRMVYPVYPIGELCPLLKLTHMGQWDSPQPCPSLPFHYHRPFLCSLKPTCLGRTQVSPPDYPWNLHHHCKNVALETFSKALFISKKQEELCVRLSTHS